jgi:hypothetical protein
MEVQYFEPSIDFNEAFYSVPLDLLWLPFGIDKESEKKIIDHFEEVKRCIGK